MLGLFMIFASRCSCNFDMPSRRLQYLTSPGSSKLMSFGPRSSCPMTQAHFPSPHSYLVPTARVLVQLLRLLAAGGSQSNGPHHGNSATLSYVPTRTKPQ